VIVARALFSLLGSKPILKVRDYLNPNVASLAVNSGNKHLIQR
jgi:hypothetical protein